MADVPLRPCGHMCGLCERTRRQQWLELGVVTRELSCPHSSLSCQICMLHGQWVNAPGSTLLREPDVFPLAPTFIGRDFMFPSAPSLEDVEILAHNGHSLETIELLRHQHRENLRGYSSTGIPGPSFTAETTGPVQWSSPSAPTSVSYRGNRVEHSSSSPRLPNGLERRSRGAENISRTTSPFVPLQTSTPHRPIDALPPSPDPAVSNEPASEAPHQDGTSWMAFASSDTAVSSSVGSSPSLTEHGTISVPVVGAPWLYNSVHVQRGETITIRWGTNDDPHICIWIRDDNKALRYTASFAGTEGIEPPRRVGVWTRVEHQ